MEKEKEKAKLDKYTYAKGRRKNAIAMVRLFTGKGASLINNKPVAQVYPSRFDQRIINGPFITLESADKFYFTAKTTGGGIAGQKEAIRHALSRALVKFDETFRPALKAQGFMTRDPRMVERKHTGMRKARKKEQYSKR